MLCLLVDSQSFFETPLKNHDKSTTKTEKKIQNIAKNKY